MNNPGITSFLRNGLYLMRRNWRQMAVYALIIWVLDVVLLAPPTSWFLKKLGSNGDVIVTGTPGGVGAGRKPPLWMKSGDVVEIEITGVGALRNPIIDEDAG